MFDSPSFLKKFEKISDPATPYVRSPIMAQFLNSAVWFVYGAFIVLGIGTFLRNLKNHHHDSAMTAAAHRAAEGERRRYPML